MNDLQGLKIDIATKSGVISFPETGTFTLKSGSSAIFPFHVNYDGVEIRLATVQPFCSFTNKNKHYNVMTLVDGIAPEMVFKGKVKINGSGIKTSIRNGNTVVGFATQKRSDFQVNGVSFLVLPDNDTKNAYLIGKANDEKLVISKALVLENGEEISFISKNQENIDFAIYPASANVSSMEGKITKSKSPLKNCSEWRVSVSKVETGIQLIQADASHFVLKSGSLDLSKVNDVFITFDYRGDRGICMMNGELQTDDLYTSKPWTIGLKKYQEALKTTDMYFHFLPMAKDAPYLSYLDKEVLPDFGDKKSFLEIKKPLISVEYKVNIQLNKK
jgi:ribosomal 50S subunit-recycling heat shock protein